MFRIMNASCSITFSLYLALRLAMPVQGQCAPRQIGQCFNSGGASGDNFGGAVAIDGSTAVIGAWADDTIGGVGAGSAYVFVRNGGDWTQQAQLLAFDGQADDGFGNAAISGETVVVGSWWNNTPAGAQAGSAYVFVRNGDRWDLEAQLFASNTADAGDWFGAWVAIDGDTIIVGAPNDWTPVGQTGSAYVFVRSNGVWLHQARLYPQDPSPNHRSFGFAAGLDGDTAIVGAYRAVAPNGAQAGLAYVFVRSGTTWTQQAQLAANDGVRDDYFGFTVSISNDIAMIGAPQDGTAAGGRAGSVYVFARDATTWSQNAHLVASDGAANDRFGWDVRIAGTNAIVGAMGDDLPGRSDAGSAYVLSRVGGNWVERAHISAADAAAGDNFGCAVGISGDTGIVGALADDNSGGANAGSAYLFKLGLAPEITTSPVALTVEPGLVAELSVAACGEPTLRYQWRKDGFPLNDGPSGNGSVISGVDTETLTITNAQPGDAGAYDVLVNNSRGSDQSSAAILTVGSTCPADLDTSGAVDLSDLAILLSNFGTPSGATPEQGDLDRDHDVDLQDLANLLANFGTSC